MTVVSYVLHPLLMPTFTFATIFYFLPESIQPITEDSIPYLLFAILITTFLIPLMSVSALKFTATISSLALEKREERILPFLFITVFYGLTTYLFIEKVQVNNLLALMMIATTLLILLLTAITMQYKISIHGAGISGSVGFLLALTYQYNDPMLMYPLAVFVVLTGLVMTSRLYLNAHTIEEVSLGALLGFLFCFAALYFLA